MSAPPDGKEKARAEPDAVRKALEELVALDDLRIIISAGCNGLRNSEQDRRWRVAHDEFYRRKPIGWAAARDALKETK